MDDTITTTVSLDRETYRALRHLAADRDAPVRALIREALREYLDRQGGRKARG